MYCTFITSPEKKTTYYRILENGRSEEEAIIYGPFKTFDTALRHAGFMFGIKSNYATQYTKRTPSEIAQNARKPETGPKGGSGRGQGRKPIDPNGETEIFCIRLTSAQNAWLKAQENPRNLLRDFITSQMRS